MSWLKLDDTWDDHPKLLMCSDLAQLLWVKANSYACKHKTDGFVPTGAVCRLVRCKNPEALAIELVNAIPHGFSVGLWVPVEGGWMIHDFLEYNPSRKESDDKRRWEAERKATYRNGRTPNVPVGQERVSQWDKSECPAGTNGGVPRGVPPLVPVGVPLLPSPPVPIPIPIPIRRERALSPDACEEGRNPCVSLPAAWAPKPEHVDKAAREGLDISRSSDRFRAHARSTGRRCADWDSAFEVWLDGDKTRGPSARRRAVQPPTPTGPSWRDNVRVLTHDGEKTIEEVKRGTA